MNGVTVSDFIFSPSKDYIFHFMEHPMVGF